MKKLWEKGVSVNREIEDFTIGKDPELDLFLARYDAIGTIAHAEMLYSIGILEESFTEENGAEFFHLDGWKMVKKGD